MSRAKKTLTGEEASPSAKVLPFVPPVRPSAPVIDLATWRARGGRSPEAIASSLAAQILLTVVLREPDRWSDHTIAAAVRQVDELYDVEVEEMREVLDVCEARFAKEGAQ